MREIRLVVLCDVCGAATTEEAFRVTVAGEVLDLDLCARHRAQLRAGLTRYLPKQDEAAVARRNGRDPRAPRGPAKRKNCPTCGRSIGVNNIARHLVTHEGVPQDAA